MAEYIGLGILDLLFIVIGITLFCGKGAWMIAGYNTMPTEDKAKWNIKTLSRSLGKVSIVSAAYTILVGVAIYYNLEVPIVVSTPIYIAALIIWVVYINKNNKFRN